MSINNFDDKYLNTKLSDGLTVREHMKQSYENIKFYSNSNLSTRFSSDIIEQYNFVINNINNRSNTYEINNWEEIFIKTFLEEISKIRKKYWVHLDRYGDGGLMFYYKNDIVGRINLRNVNSISMQILTGPYGMNAKTLHNLTFEEALNYIKKWCNYIKYHLKEQRKFL